MADDGRNEADDTHDEDEVQGMRVSWHVGTGAALGLALGTMVFAITDDAFWLAVGPVFGVTLGAAFQANRDG